MGFCNVNELVANASGRIKINPVVTTLTFFSTHDCENEVTL